jgi:hypothetical protein
VSDPTAVPDAPTPRDVAASPEYDRTEPDPTPAEVQPGDPSYVEPAANATRPTVVVTPVTDGAGDSTVTPEA